MPYDPVREAALSSPRDGTVSLPSPVITNNTKGLTGSPGSSRFPQVDADSRAPAVAYGTRDVLAGHPPPPYVGIVRSHPPQERRSNSLAHLLSNDERPWTSHSSSSANTPPLQQSPGASVSRTPSDEAVYARPPVIVPSSYRPPVDIQPITLPPAERRQSHPQYRDRDSDLYPPQPTRVSLSPVATRTTSPIRIRSPEDILSFPHRPSRPSLSPVAIREAEEILYSYPHRPSKSPVSHRPTPLTLSPAQSLRAIDDRPTTSDQPVIAPLLPSPSPPPRPSSPPLDMPSVSPASEAIKPAPLPYAPHNRLTPASSILVPLSSSEIEIFRNSRNPLRSKQSSPESVSITLPPSDEKKKLLKRRRDTGDEDSYPSNRSRDAGRVVEHYNSRPNVNVQQRQESPIIGLKSFNNWIKSVLIAKWATPVLGEGSGTEASTRRSNRSNGRVLDMGCGKGGDLQKWQKARAQLYCGLDVAGTSIEQARDRATSLRSTGSFNANFQVLDCYSHPISDVLSKEILHQPFDVVSMQFCMHYAFENVSKARMMLENVARYLRPGGRFIGTIPNASFLTERLNELPLDVTQLSFGNSVYNITFENRQQALFGQRYQFFLLDAVEDVPEYVVYWDNFLQLAAEHGLQLLEKKEFHDIFIEEREHRDYGPLLRRMKVVDEQGDSQMDEDQWEAANIYIGFVFEKR